MAQRTYRPPESPKHTGRRRLRRSVRRVLVIALVIAALYFVALNFPELLSQMEEATPFEWFLWLVLGTGIATLVVLTLLSRIIRWTVVRGISKRMEQAAVPSAAPEEAIAPVSGPDPDLPPDLVIEVVQPRKLPAASVESQRRVEAIVQRGAQVRRTYQLGITFLAAATVAATYTAATGTSGGRWEPLAWYAAFTATYLFGVWGLGAGALLSKLIETVASRSFITGLLFSLLFGWIARLWERRRGWDEEILKPRPWIPALVGGAWVLAAAWQVYRLADIDRATAALLAAAIGVYLVWVWFRMLRLDYRYPVHPPLFLLALRVFDSPSLERFLDLIDRWPWIGVTQYLHGPRTTAQNLGDKVRFFLGRGDTLVIEDEQEMEEAFRKFSPRRDRQLRYPQHALQCNNLTWKQGLFRMLDRAHVVVMDLSTFGERHRGCAFEIGTLIDTLPTDRFLLLIDDATDMDALREVIAHQWRAMAVDSPNRAARLGVIKLLHMGGPVALRAGESVREWWRRQPDYLRDDRLVGMLCDIALQTAPADPATARRWSRFPPVPPIPVLERFLTRPGRAAHRHTLDSETT